MRWWLRFWTWIDGFAERRARREADERAMYQASVDALATLMDAAARDQNVMRRVRGIREAERQSKRIH